MHQLIYYYEYLRIFKINDKLLNLYSWLCFMSIQQRGQLETAPPFTVPCEGCEARFLHRFHRESNLGPSCVSPLHYHCTTPAP